MRIHKFICLVLFLIAGNLSRAEASPVEIGLLPPAAGNASGDDPSFFYHYWDRSGNVADLSLSGISLDANSFYINSGMLNVIGGLDAGTYSLAFSGPGVSLSPQAAFLTDNVLYPESSPVLDYWGLLFSANGMEINIWGNGPDNYSFWSHNSNGYNVAFDGGQLEGGELVSTEVIASGFAVPEPSSLCLLAFGLFGIWGFHRKLK
jgi:hypothetical protein